MKNVKVLGSGCKKCQTTQANVAAAAKALGVEIELEKVQDFQQIAAFGVMSTPAVVVDGKVVHSGGVPSEKAAAEWLS